MSYIKRWDLGNMQGQINACASQVLDPRNDGFTAWGCKQDLIRIKYQLEEILRRAPKFADEDAFVAEIEKELVWKRLNDF